MTSTYLTGDVHAGLRKRALDILSDYAEVYVGAITPQLREQALAGEVLRQAKAIEASIVSRSGFWPAVWAGIVSTALWTLLVTTLVVAAVLFGSDLIDVWRTFISGAKS